VASKTRYDAAVIGSGPNGLAAAITLAQAGKKVIVHETGDAPGGALRSGESTLPGFIHDLGAAVFPMAVDTPFFRDVPLKDHGLEFIFSQASVAHPFDDGSAGVIHRDLKRTVEGLGPDGERYRSLMLHLLQQWDDLEEDLFGPPHIPRHIEPLAAFVLRACMPVNVMARLRFATPCARGIMAGLAAHSILPLRHPMSSPFALIMAVHCHRPGWPIAKGGSGSLAAALSSYLRSLGGEIVTGSEVRNLSDIEPAMAVFFDTAPSNAVKIAGRALPASYGKRIRRFSHGPGAFKVDWALNGPIPWRASVCAEAATVHIGGTLEEIVRAEGEVWKGIHPQRPFVLLVQPSLFDPGRAPEGRHTAWAYCHVPGGSDFDMTSRIEAQVERFAPGFTDLILARHVMNPVDIERFDANCIGGDIAGGANTMGQVFGRPVFSTNPYAMPAPGMYLCSASTPPGGGVHGLCGYHAARSLLKKDEA